jgi:phosphohistidine swiveling domain-containing protein
MKWKLISMNKNPPLLREIKETGFFEGYKKLFGYEYTDFLFFKECIYFLEETHKGLFDLIEKKFNENYKCFKDLLDLEAKETKEFLDFSEDVSKLNFKKFSKEELLKHFEDFVGHYKKCTKYLLLRSGVIDPILQKAIIHIHKEDSQILFSITKETKTAQLTKDLLRYAIKGGDTKELVNKYGWLNMEDGVGESFSEKYFLDRIAEMKASNPQKKLDQLREETKSIRDKTQKIIAGFNDKEKEIYEVMQEHIYRRASLNEELSFVGYRLKPFFTEIAERLGLIYIEMFYLSINELKEALLENKIPDRELIDERISCSAVLLKNGISKVVSGKDLEELKIDEEDLSHLKSVNGNCTFKGKVKAKAKIVMDTSDLNKVKKGDVLIAQFTTPDYIIVMEKASAIVTDVGGVTSHAAVLSRELGVPCVIGTKIATKVFKDNDMVEVDADKGIARKLK